MFPYMRHLLPGVTVVPARCNNLVSRWYPRVAIIWCHGGTRALQ